MPLPGVLKTIVEVWAGCNVGFTGSLLYGLFRLSRRPLPRRGASPPLCLLRPCEGDEPGLFENLRSSLTVSYAGPRRVLLLVPSQADPAYAVAMAVIDAARRDPDLRSVPALVLLTAPRALENRKVAQLASGLCHSDEEVIVCADSDVRLQGDDLQLLVDALLDEAGVGSAAGAAFAAPVEVAPRTFWDRASSAIVGASPQSFLALYGLSAILGGAPSMAGALCAFRRGALSAIGGLDGVRDCLGEDNELARRLVQAGYRIALSPRPAFCHDGGRKAGEVIARVARWLTVVRAQRPALFGSYPLLVAATPAVLLLCLLVRSPILIGFTAAFLSLRTLLAFTLRRLSLRSHGMLRGVLAAFFDVLLGECLLWLGFARASLSRTIRWRGHPFYVERGGRLRPAALLWFFTALFATTGSGCAAWHDLFQRDRPSEELLREAMRLPSPASTDVGIALGCPSEDDGEPSPCLRCRVKGALRALREKRVQAVIFSGGAAHNRHVEGAVMASLARSLGVPDSQILVEGQALTTWQNLRNSQRIMNAHGFRTALLISTRDHLPRARRFAEYYEIPVALLACEDD
jgi:ceramide glucosyltransferase